MYGHFNSARLSTTISRLRFGLMAMRCAITGQLPLAHQGSGMPFIQAPDQRNRYGYPVMHGLAA